MPRKPISEQIQTSVLTKSRRRCCICYGLHRSTDLKQGQIAHLDKNSSNNSEENLAFLCFDHHDQYDSSTRQSKNFTIKEVKQYRSELISDIEAVFSRKTFFGATVATDDSIIGHYVRDGSYGSSELFIRKIDSSKYHIKGESFYGENHEFGPKIGILDFVESLQSNNIIQYRYTMMDGTIYKADLNFLESKLIVKEENWHGMFGLSVIFQGEYTRLP